MSDKQLQHRIALSLIKGIGPKLARNLIAYLGSESALFEEKIPTLAKVPGIGPALNQLLLNIDRKELLKRADQELLFIEKHRLTALFFSDGQYPGRLSFCEDAPLMLYLHGQQCHTAQRMIGIVGTRTPSDEGIDYCEKLVSDLAVQTSRNRDCKRTGLRCGYLCTQSSPEKRVANDWSAGSRTGPHLSVDAPEHCQRNDGERSFNDRIHQ